MLLLETLKKEVLVSLIIDRFSGLIRQLEDMLTKLLLVVTRDYFYDFGMSWSFSLDIGRLTSYTRIYSL